jgi:RNA polymerase sigma-70 factor (ECF subfamily)
MIACGTPRSEDRGATTRFEELALPLLGDVYTLARYWLGRTSDAEDAVQECYLRALLHFDTYHGPAFKPWLFAILRNVCNAEHARRSKLRLRSTEFDPETLEETAPLWQETRDTPETELLHQIDGETIRQLVAELPPRCRETIVLREINDLSYREIADVIGAPIGTVMSRLARARYMLRAAWKAKEGTPARTIRAGNLVRRNARDAEFSESAVPRPVTHRLR